MTRRVVLDPRGKPVTAVSPEPHRPRGGRRLGRRPAGPVRAAELAPLLRLPEPETEAALDGLVEAGLLEPEGGDGYRLPALLRLYLAALPEPALPVTA